MRAGQARRIKHIGVNYIMPYVGVMIVLVVMSLADDKGIIGAPGVNRTRIENNA